MRIRLGTALSLAVVAILFAWAAAPTSAHFDVGGAECKDVRFQRFPEVLGTDVRARNVSCVKARELVHDVAFSESVPWDCKVKRHRSDDPHFDLLCTQGKRRVSWAGYQ